MSSINIQFQHFYIHCKYWSSYKNPESLFAITLYKTTSGTHWIFENKQQVFFKGPEYTGSKYTDLEKAKKRIVENIDDYIIAYYTEK